MGWRIELFGGPRIVSPTGECVERFPTQKSAGLLAYLALTLPRTHSREVLAELFWPDKEPALSRNSLSAALSALRSLLGDTLVTDKLRVGLDASRLTTDVAEFEALLKTGDVSGAGRLFTGELLPGVYDDWVLVERERLGARFEECAEANAKRAVGQVGKLHRFPLIASGFVGREDERAELLRLLRGDARLVTLQGTGGVGKTRLAHEVARQCREGFPGGVFWVALDDVRGGDALLRRVAVALQIALQPQLSLRKQLGRSLAPRGPILLVLDNVEQIPDAGLSAQAILECAPECRLLVTSRRRLALRAESVLELRPLPLPDAERLFRERASAAQIGLALADDEADAIAALCRRLDGLPLALELAAARIVALTPQQMLARLEERFRLLQTRMVDLPERHRTLRATISWSYDALPDDEKGLLAQLSIFASAFSLEDVEAVCEGADVLEGIASLRESSLLCSERVTGGYILLESLRDYAAERLAERPALRDAARARHLARYLAMAEQQLSRLRTRDEAEALRRLDALAPNLSAALETAPAEWAPRLALALARPLQRRGFFVEAVVALEKGLAARALPDLLWERAGLHLDQGELAPAREVAERARALYATAGDTLGIARAENLLGQALYKEGRLDEARVYLHRALESLGSLDAELDTAIVRNNLALVELEDPEGNSERAVGLLTDALAVRRACGDLRGVAAAVANLGNLAFAREDWRAAERYFGESLEVEAALGHLFGIARALNNLGETAERRAAADLALEFYLGAHRLFVELGHDYADYTESLLHTLVRRAAIPEERIAERRDSLARKTVSELIRDVCGGAR